MTFVTTDSAGYRWMLDAGTWRRWNEDQQQWEMLEPPSGVLADYRYFGPGGPKDPSRLEHRADSAYRDGPAGICCAACGKTGGVFVGEEPNLLCAACWDRRAYPSRNGHVAPPEPERDAGFPEPDDDEPREPLPIQPAGQQPTTDRPASLVDGLLQEGEMLVLGAGRGVGKSWWGMDLAKQLAQGSGRFMGTYAVRQSARVLYCHGELDPWAAFDRWERLRGDGKIPADLLESFEPWRIRIVRRRVTSSGDGVATSTEQVDAQLDPRIEQAIVAERVGVLILDPWAVFFGGRENDNSEVEMALACLRRLQLDHGLTVVALHHFGKADRARDPEDLWRGASRLADWASTRVTLLPYYTPAQAKEMRMSRLQARQYATVKTLRRNHASPSEIAVKWNADTGAWDRWRVSEGEGDASGLTAADVAAACPMPDGWRSVLATAAALELSERKTRLLLEQAHQQGLLEEFAGPRGARGWRVPRKER